MKTFSSKRNTNHPIQFRNVSVFLIFSCNKSPIDEDGFSFHVINPN